MVGSPKKAFVTIQVNDPDLVKELDKPQGPYSMLKPVATASARFP
jgi:hypothetical protein